MFSHLPVYEKQCGTESVHEAFVNPAQITEKSLSKCRLAQRSLT